MSGPEETPQSRVTRRDAPPARTMVKATNLLVFDQPDPVGLDGDRDRRAPDRELYIVCIRPRPDLFPDEGRARRSLHVNHRER
jgi:hypothetical protein